MSSKPKAELSKSIPSGVRFWEAIVDTARDAFVFIDARGLITLFNRAAEGMFGYEAAEVLGKNVSILMAQPYREEHDGYLEHYARTRERKAIGRVRDVQARRKNGEIFPIELAVSATEFDGGEHFSAVIRDLTEKQAMEQQLRQSQKLEAIGTLASGVAHDFSNLLMGISGCCKMALEKLEGDGARRYLEEAIDAAARGSNLTRQLLAFSRQRTSERRRIAADEVVRTTSSLLGHMLGSRVTLEVELGAEGVFVFADPGELEQIVMNLAVNARDALPGRGTIRLVTCKYRIGGRGHRHGSLPDGVYFGVRVEDDGIGISDELIGRIFEPFFTTKDVGKGTGLGLSTVYGIVRDLGGAIDVQSELGKGTQFAVLMPVTTREASEA